MQMFLEDTLPLMDRINQLLSMCLEESSNHRDLKRYIPGEDTKNLELDSRIRPLIKR